MDSLLKKIFFSSFLFFLLIPLFISAITFGPPFELPTFEELVDAVISFISWTAIVIAPILIIIAAFYFLTSGGDPERVRTAKRIIFWVIIGLIIVLLARGLPGIIKVIVGGPGPPGPPVEICNNGLDDDGDGFTDCADHTDCDGRIGPGGEKCCSNVSNCDQDDCVIESCNAANNECRYINRPQCDSTECVAGKYCNVAGGDCRGLEEDINVCQICAGFTWTDNGGSLNCCGNDPNENSPYELAESICNDGNDNDCNGLTDCADPNCAADPACAAPNLPPTADARVGDAPKPTGTSVTVTEGEIVYFDGSTYSSDPEDGVNLSKYEWDFEDDGAYDWSSPVTGVTTHIYSAGSYTARLQVTDSDGATDTDTVSITVNPAPPLVVSITSPSDGQIFLQGTSITFTGSVTGGVTPYTYTWTSNLDGVIGNTLTFNKNNLSLGVHTITFQVTDSAPVPVTESDTITITITDDNTPPTIQNAQVNPTSGPSGTIFVITADITDASGVDPTTTIAHIQNPDETDVAQITLYDDGAHNDGAANDGTYGVGWDSTGFPSGAYYVDITACDLVGNCGEIENIGGIASPLAVSITSPQNEDVFNKGDSITFDSSVTGGTPPYTFSWTSSIDGNIGSLQTFNKNDLSVGDHTITLTVTALGETDTATIDIHIPPTNFDWSHKVLPAAPPAGGADWMTPVKTQGCGDCWAFATIAVVEAKYNIQENDPTLDIDLSEQYLVSDCCAFGDCSSGTVAFDYIKTSGVPTEACYSYLGSDSSCPATCDDGSPIEFWKITDKSLIGGDRAIMKYNLINKGPIYAYMNFTGYDPVTHTCSSGSSNHGVVIVGYDDAEGVWILRNHFGAAWCPRVGECYGGYFKVAYGECNIETDVLQTVDGVIPP